MILWPAFVAAFLLALRTTGVPAKRKRKPSTDEKKRRRRRRRRRRARKRKTKRRRKRKTTPADKLPDPLKDLFGPKTVPKPKAKRRRRKPPKPAPRPKRRRRRRRRVPKPIPPTRSRVKPASKPVSRRRQPTVAEQFVADLRAGELNRNGVAKAQRAMGGLDPDGIGGGKTMGKVEALLKRSVDWSDISWPRTPSIPKAPSAAIAARELWDYVHVYKGKRRPRIRMYQRTMGMKSTPGRIGPSTRARVLELTELEL